MYFSIIIPVYNVEKYLATSLDSVLAQNFGDFEVICVNDGATDNSAAILEHYEENDKRIKVITQSNAGLSAARNTGLRVASGEYILFLDSDDWIEPNTLQILSENLNGEDLLCFNGRRYIEGRNQYEESDNLQCEEEITGWDYYCRHALEHRNFAFVCVVLRCYRRQYLVDNNLWFKEGIYHEDNLFTPYACYYAQKVKVISDVLYDYRVRESSIMTTRSLKHWKDIIGIANELSNFFVSKDGVKKKTIYQALTHHYQSAFCHVTPKEDKELLPLVNWKLYRAVSRTKPRHKVQFMALCISPRLFRLINRQ